MINQEKIQTALRAQTGTSLTLNEDWLALFDIEGIASGAFNGRLVDWINARLGTGFSTLADAQRAFAIANGQSRWGDIDDIPIADPDLRVALNFATQIYRLWDGQVAKVHDLASFPNLDVVRATPATAWVAGPTLAHFSAGQARVGVVDPLTGTPIGALFEPASTRLTSHFATPFSGWTPFLGAQVTKYEPTVFGAFNDGAVIASGGGTNDFLLLDDPVTLTSGQPYGGQFFYIAGTSDTLEFEIRRLATGVPTSLQGAPGALVASDAAGTITNLIQVVLPGDVHWVRFTFTPNSTEAHRLDIGTNSAIVGATVIFLGGGLETHPIPTTPILDQPTAQNVLRAADAPSITGLASLLPAEQPVTMRLIFDVLGDSAGDRTLFALDDGTADQRHEATLETDGDLHGRTSANAVAAGAVETPVNTSGRNRVVYVADTDDFRLHTNGSLTGTDSAGSLPTTALDQLKVGHLTAGTQSIHGSLHSLELYAAAKSPAWAQQNSWDPLILHIEGDSYMAGAYSLVLGQKIANAAGRPYVANAVGGNTFQQIRDRLLAAVGLHGLTTVIWDGRANGYGDVATTLALIDDIAAVVPKNRLIILPPVRYAFETEAYNDDMTAIFEGIKERGIKTLDPFDILAPLNDGSPADLDAIKPENHHIPPSLFPFESDNVHLGEEALDAMAAAIADLL